ncbi:glycoside hydrolase family 32 protein [Sphingobacterium sp. DN00404]|uniref:Glycoside hydrolase family 32 protein n=1 Tax=Sphingobacterium micropteri TaxID=2763501 RepID=A0ABR7YUG8_9SPHI|nr:glycoside hydrolase family 32 protein [Sphingobacterium micropteri]MBD1434897.1 glycoside hydrolase family 32 protein [Sphingobacterium micropteri]
MTTTLLSVFSAILLIVSSLSSLAGEIQIKINKKYLNFPISHAQDRAQMVFMANDIPDLAVVIRLAPSDPDYWVFKDVSDLQGKVLTIRYEGSQQALSQIYQDDSIAGQDSLYKESKRPQFHFTTKRGWINDPNGLVYHDGEYHLYYQHNPYEREWENMHWGHAVSKDLVHWEELPVALFPDELGTMYSGSAVVDYENTAGYNQQDKPAMVIAYTAAAPDRQTQCIAYSLDNGRTFRKYEGNPVIDSKDTWNSVDTRDPKVFWYSPSDHWVMVLNERDGHSIYTSKNLKEWHYESHVTGFWECPELFELPIDGDATNTKWVMYGASGTYMIGNFNGKQFIPERGKYQFTTGSIYAAQTFTNMSDNRRVQIGWGRVKHPGMPFNGMMLLPTELTLRTTRDGLRLFSEPTEEIEQLFTPLQQWTNLTSEKANELLVVWNSEDCLRIRTTLVLSHATSAGISFFGQHILDYDLNGNKVNGVFYSPDDMTSMEISADIYIDKTNVEVFIDGGAYSYSFERKFPTNGPEGLNFWGNNIEVKNLELFRIASIWD